MRAATNIAWNWGAFNSFDPANVDTPASTEGYTILSSTGCNNQAMDFTGFSSFRGSCCWNAFSCAGDGVLGLDLRYDLRVISECGD